MRYLAVAAVWAWTAPALADNTAQTLTYDLVLNGAVVGSREVSIQYMEPFNPGDTESRLLETWTRLDASMGAWNAQVENHSTAHITKSNSNFTSSMSFNGDLSEVQGHSMRDGRWALHGIFNQQLSSWQHRRTEVDMSSLDLLDPVRSQHLTTLTEAQILSAETGTIMTGPVSDLGERTLVVNGQEVPVHAWSWTPEEGRFELAWSSDGLLLDWKAEFKGQTVHGRLRELPPPRSFGAAAPVGNTMPEIVEEEL
jgi:hypothetical protein